MNLMNQVQIQDESICVSLNANAIGKGMNSPLFHLAMDK